jgi:hypothetical protein
LRTLSSLPLRPYMPAYPPSLVPTGRQINPVYTLSSLKIQFNVILCMPRSSRLCLSFRLCVFSHLPHSTHPLFLISSHKQYLAKNKTYEAPRHLVFLQVPISLDKQKMS